MRVINEYHLAEVFVIPHHSRKERMSSSWFYQMILHSGEMGLERQRTLTGVVDVSNRR